MWEGRIKGKFNRPYPINNPLTNVNYQTFSISCFVKLCSRSVKLLCCPSRTRSILPLPSRRLIRPIGVSTRKKISVSNTVLLILPNKSESLFHTKSIFSLSQKDNIPANPMTKDNVRKIRCLKIRYSAKNPTVITSTVSFDDFLTDMLEKWVDKRSQRRRTTQNDQQGYQYEHNDQWY